MKDNLSVANMMDDEEEEEKIILQLFDVKGIKIQDVRLKSGQISPVYVDLRVLVSFPQLMKDVTSLMWKKINKLNLSYEVICGVPYTALPIATVISVTQNKSMVMRRKEAKSYGTKQMIEGSFKPGDRALVIEDVITGGASILETAIDLYRSGLRVEDAIVLLDRNQGGVKNLKNLGIKAHSVLNLKKVVSVLSKEKKIECSLQSKVVAWVDENSAALNPIVEEEWNSTTTNSKQKRKPFSERMTDSSLRNPITTLLFSIMNRKQTNVCVAIDVSTSKQVLELVRVVAPFVCAVKLHVDIIEDFSHENLVIPLTKLSEEHQFVIFEDRKFADIGNTVRSQYSSGIYRIVDWAQLVTSHVVAGPGTLDALKMTASASGKDRGCLLLAQMSSDGNLLNKNVAQNAISAAFKHDEFVVGFICQERMTSDPRFIHFTPGVSLESTGDSLGQVYKSPQNAIEKGADVVIVGRALTQAADVVETAKRFQKISYEAYLSQC